EAGYPEVNIGLWSGVFVSAGTPPAIAHKLDTELRRALADGGVREKLKAMAVNPGGGPAEEFRQKIDGDIKVFADVVKAANLKFRSRVGLLAGGTNGGHGAEVEDRWFKKKAFVSGSLC